MFVSVPPPIGRDRSHVAPTPTWYTVRAVASLRKDGVPVYRYTFGIVWILAIVALARIILGH